MRETIVDESVLDSALCSLNGDYQQVIHSKEYIYGKRLCKTFFYLAHGNIIGLFKHMIKQRKGITDQRNFSDCTTFSRSCQINLPIRADFSASITFYLCVVGNYDNPPVPLIQCTNCKYVLFTDHPELPVIGWQTRPIPGFLKEKNNIYINRYIKMHPWEFFDTDYSVYLDGNVRMITSFSHFLPLISEKTGLAMFTHPYRNCLYSDARACCYLGKGNPAGIQQQIAAYAAEGMPEHFGLKEATVILYDMRNMAGREIFEKWWSEFLRFDSQRDQLSLPYVLWKNGYKISDIGTLGEDIRNDCHFQVTAHPSHY